MKTIKSTVLALAIALLCSGVNAQTTKIAQVNSQDIITALPEMTEIQANLETYGKELTETIEKSQVEYNTLVESYVAERDNLTETARMAKEQELSDRRDRIQQFQENAQNLFAQKQQELMEPVFTKVKNAIEEVSKAQGLTWVIDLSGASMAYVAADAPDITKEVLAKLGIQK